jgi:hypothetical protein
MRYTRYILILVYAINLFRGLITFKISSVSQFKDPDFLNFYKPAAQDFYKVYISNDPNLLNLSGLVTPLFPFFLKIFGFGALAQFVYFIIFLLILVLTYKITSRISSKSIAIFAVLLVSLEPSLFISSLSLSPELLFSFILTLALYFGVCKPIENEDLNYLVLALLIGISVLVRPIALVMIIFLFLFFVINYYITSKPIFLFASVTTTLFALAWSTRNSILHGFFNVSSISSNNIMWHEGVPALSEQKGISFEEAANIESTLKNQLIGDEASVAENYNYDSRRGLELIFEYPFGWIESHFKGVGKVIFGVFKSKHRILNEEIFGVHSQTLQSIHFITLGFITLLIWMLFLGGIKTFYGPNFLYAHIAFLILIATLVPATGQVAYGRFRSPVVPIICIIAAVGAQNLKDKYSAVIKSRK